MLSIAVSVRGQFARIALLDGDLLTEFYLWNPEAPEVVGDIFSGRITARVPAMAGSFVDIGSATGFLPDSAGAAGLTEGTAIAVRVTRAAQSGKGPRLALEQETPGKTGLMRRGPGPLVELARRFPEAAIVIDDYALIAVLRQSLGDRVAYKSASFDAILEDEVALLAEPICELPYGAVMHITPAAALTAIDIDAGVATGRAEVKSQSQLALNISLIPAIVRQIVLRNLSGAILIDFAGMKSGARKKLVLPLTDALKNDPLKPRLLGFSNFGFAEISRPRILSPLHELLK